MVPAAQPQGNAAGPTIESEIGPDGFPLYHPVVIGPTGVPMAAPETALSNDGDWESAVSANCEPPAFLGDRVFVDGVEATVQYVSRNGFLDLKRSLSHWGKTLILSLFGRIWIKPKT